MPTLVNKVFMQAHTQLKGCVSGMLSSRLGYYALLSALLYCDLNKHTHCSDTCHTMHYSMYCDEST